MQVNVSSIGSADPRASTVTSPQHQDSWELGTAWGVPQDAQGCRML